MGSLRRYSVANRTGTTAATQNHAVINFYNPSSDKVVRIYEIEWVKTAAVADHFALIKTSTAGTPAATITPTATSNWDSDPVAPISGFVCHLGPFSAQPSLTGANHLRRTNLIGAVGVGFLWLFDKRPLDLPPGVGAAIIVPANINIAIQAGDFTVVWEE